jgi:hypothetical protein
MDKNSFPGSTMHGEAWRRFANEMHGKSDGPEEQRNAWDWFLAGWKAKSAQRAEYGR